MEASAHAMLTLAWFGLLCALLTCYVVTDGFDLGVGILSLSLREERDRDLVFQSIAHVWDANETWLVVLGGALFGAFPAAYALILDSAYVPVTLMIAGFIMRGAAIEFRHVARWKRGWDKVFGIGSLIAALSQGWVLGRIVTGLSGDGLSIGFAAAAAVGVAAGYALLGATYLIKKTGGPLQAHARRHAMVAVFATVSAAIVVSVGTLVLSPVGRMRWQDPAIFTALLTLAAVAAGAFLVIVRALVTGRPSVPFRAAIVMFLASLSGLALSVYPNFIPGRLSLAEAVASDNTLVFMLFGIGLLMPVMLAYNLYQYFAFRGRLMPTEAA
jgi:cytochrome d ubiquinol oxidase subunit II